jgi:hypothetical protein
MKEEKTANFAAFAERGDENLDWETAVHQPECFKYLNNLAWIDLDRSEGLEYWKSMELMGRYVSANHDIIQQGMVNHPGAVSVLPLEKRHRFVWKMQCGDEEVIVHRKGATPVDNGVIGVIPGSMATPAFGAMVPQTDPGDVVAWVDPARVKRAPADRRKGKKR